MDSNEIRRRWAERSGEYSPDYYAYYGPNETSEAIRARLDGALDSSAAVLELGCSAGRHLAHLFEHGYEDLSGIDINDDAFDVMADEYPGLAERGTFYRDAIENVVTDFDDDQFDAVFSVETLQHVHPDDEWVFAELARIADSLLVTVENEGSDESADETETEDGTGDAAESGNGRQSARGDHSRADEVSVNYVADDLPLYYRDWNRVFTDLGLVEVGSEPADRDTLRMFRPPDR